MGAGEARMRFEVLGPLRVLRGGEELSLGTSKPRALLGVLLLHPGRPVGIDELTEALWDGEPPVSAPTNMRGYVGILRRAMGSAFGVDGARRVETRAPGYLIRVEPGELDLVEFEDLEAQGSRMMERGEIETAARLWRQALDLWRGAALADIRGGPGLTAAVARLEERRLRLVEAWIDVQLAVGAHAQLVSELRGLVAAEPLHEPLWARLMIALYRSGRTADALAAFGQAREHLIEVGLEPGRQLQRIQRAVLAGDAVVQVGETSGDGLSPAAPSLTMDVCPYRGLMPFEAGDAAWYFGRERLVAELITYLSSQLTPPSLVAVVGASGSGKSSLLRAGLLPALADGALPVARDWPVVELTPGAQPLDALRDAVAGIQTSTTKPARPEEPDDQCWFADAVRNALGAGRRAVVVVDQLEELFTLCRDERERQAFITALCTAAGAGRSREHVDAVPAVVIFGLRADFYGQCTAYPDLIGALSGSQVVVSPMTAVELRHAIERPAARAGLTLEPGLVEMLLTDIGFDPEGGGHPEPGGLPLLSHALLATWQLRDGQRLTIDGYRKAGGMRGAVAATAEEVYEGLGPAEQTAARRLFTRLVAFGDATQDTSRRISRDELLDGRSPAQAEMIGEVIDALARARLIVLGSNTIEVAHEALITRWPRLQEWLTEDREGMLTHRQMTEAAYAWAALGRDPGALYRGARLTVARRWAQRGDHTDDLNDLERAFLAASVELETVEGVTERRRSVRLRQLVSAVLALMLVTGVGGAFAFWQTQRNAALERTSRSQALARTALSLPPERRPAAMLLAVEAFRTAPTPQARGALTALAPENGYRDTLVPAGGWITEVAFSPDGDLLAAGSNDGTITLWNAVQRTVKATLPAHGDEPAMAIAFSPDGRLLASGHTDGTITLWDVANRTQASTLTARDGVSVISMAVSPDGSMLASGRDDGTLMLWDLAERRQIATRDAGVPPEEVGEPLDSDTVSNVAFSPDGDVLVTGSVLGALMLWDPAEQTRLATLKPGDGSRDDDPVEAVAFHPDGTLAVAQATTVPGNTADPDTQEVPPHAVALWDVRRRAVTTTIPASSASALAFSADGATLATGAVGGVESWDLSDGPDRAVLTSRYDVAGATSVAFSPDGATLAAEDGRSVVLLDPSARGTISDGFVEHLAISPDGASIAASGSGPKVDLWDAETKQHIAAFDSPGYGGGDLAFRPDGEWLGRTGWDLVALYHVAQEEKPRVAKTLDRPDGTRVVAAGGAQGLGFSANPRRVFVADSFHEMLLVWRPGGLRIEKSIPGLRTAELSPTGDVLATATTSGVTLWNFPDLDKPEEIGPFARFDDAPLVAFSDDGSTLATADRDLVTLWDTAERTPITSFTEELPPTDIAIAPDNRTVALAMDDLESTFDKVTVWDAISGASVADLTLGSPASGEVTFLSGGTRIAAADGDTIRFWDLDPERASTRICSTLDRSLTQEEWADFLPDQPYRATCDP